MPQDINGNAINGDRRELPEAIERRADEIESLASRFGLREVRRAARQHLDDVMVLLRGRPDLSSNLRHGDMQDEISASQPDRIVSMFRRLASEASRAPGVSAPAPAQAGPSPAAFDLAAIPQSEQLVGWLIPGSISDRANRNELIGSTVKAKLNGQYAGLTVEVDDVSTDTNEMRVSARILNANGVQVGSTTREFHRDDSGKLWVYHAYMALEPHVQGQGFAEAWNGRLMDWYSESGLDRIEVTANIDVGGYTWARQGFDFKNRSAADDIKNRLEREMSRNAPNYTAEQTIEVNDILTRMALPFGHANFPTAYEVSQVGRLPGQGKRDPWPGKKAMLGSFWSGVKAVPPPGARRVP